VGRDLARPTGPALGGEQCVRSDPVGQRCRRAPGAGHQQAIGIAHNAGNNSRTTDAALRHGAQVVEIDVLSIRGVLPPDESSRCAHQRNLTVVAWTVNDGHGLNELLGFGVDGITSQNLAVLDALSSKQAHG
jgi:hypothetical protein